jgi:hypothetical protein
MLKLPPISNAGGTNYGKSANSIRSCLHLSGETFTEVADFETIRKRKALKIREAARLRGEDVSNDAGWEVVEASTSISQDKKPAEYSKSFNLPLQLGGGDEVMSSPARQNISNVGGWLDRRAFAAKTETTSPRRNDWSAAARLHTNHISRTTNKAEMSESQKLFVKRCKDVMVRRYDNLQNAWRRLDTNHSDSLSTSEFVAATNSLLKEHEARILYRLIDSNGDGEVTISELQALFENA